MVVVKDKEKILKVAREMVMYLLQSPHKIISYLLNKDFSDLKGLAQNIQNNEIKNL